MRRAFLLIALPLTWFALAPQARAICVKGCELDNGNTFLGDNALVSNTTGDTNTAVGSRALSNNTTGESNTAVGQAALTSNTTGPENTAIGDGALFVNQAGTGNTATGKAALFNTIGNFNTATGRGALESNTTGESNTSIGNSALFFNTTGDDNTATGAIALDRNTTGSENTATGFAALFSNTTGNNNIALGFEAGNNLTTGSNNIDIGNVGVAGESGVIRIGTAGTQTATFIAGIRNTPLAHGAAVAVGITADGQLGVRASSARFKDAIKPMDKTSEAIFSLQPVTFRYKHELDPKDIPQFGLVAEEVEKVNPALVARDEQGKPYTVRYEAVNAMLLNEFLKQHQKVKELEAALAAINERLKAQDAKIDKVNARVELTKFAPQMVVNDQ